jgi:hypothetical protein
MSHRLHEFWKARAFWKAKTTILRSLSVPPDFLGSSYFEVVPWVVQAEHTKSDIMINFVHFIESYKKAQ